MASTDAANIGANFSNYAGNAGLGGFGLGFGKIDTRPIEDLARYTMLYNKAEYDQRQKDAEKAAEQLADLTALDISTTIPKDAKILQDKFDALTSYVRENPDALNYKNRAQWLEYNKKKADIMNDIKFAKIRSLINVGRREAIAAETNEEKKRVMESDLQQNINDTDIRTPLQLQQKYDVQLPDFGKNLGVVIDVTKTGANKDIQRQFNLFDIKEAQRAGASFELGFSAIDPETRTGQFKLLDANENFWVKGSQLLNQAISNAIDKDGNLDESKLSGIPIMNNVKAYNEYVNRIKSSIAQGYFTDNFGNKIQFNSIPFSADDYKEINIKDGISPSELGVIAQFSQWAGDQYKTQIVETDDAIQQGNLGAEWARIGIAREQLNKTNKEDLISATAVIREAADVLKNGVPKTLSDGKTTREVLAISDPNLLREFGTIDKDGTVTNVPDNVYYDKANNKLQLVYYKREKAKEEDKIATAIVGGDKPVLDRTVDLSATQWLGQIVKRKNPNKDIGGVNSLIEQFFNSPVVGRKLENINVIYGLNVQGSGGSTETESSSSSTPVVSDDSKLTDAEYYQKYKTFRKK